MSGKAEKPVKRKGLRWLRRKATGDTNAGQERQPAANLDHVQALEPLEPSYQARTMNTVDPSSRREGGQRNNIGTAVRFPVAQGMMDH